MSIAVIDFEIATSQLNSACSIGIVVIDKLEIIKEEYFLIRPPRLAVDEEMSKIHGLTKRDLLVALPFDAIWLKIKHYFNGDYILAAHNAYFDMNVLMNCLLDHKIEIPSFAYFDSITYSTKACLEAKVGGSLEARTKYFGINLANAHHALDDARAVAELLIKCTQVKNNKEIDNYISQHNIPLKEFTELKVTTEFKKYTQKNFDDKKFEGKKINNMNSSVEFFDAAHPIFSAQIVFTGDFETIDRKKATQAVLDLGGIVKNGVTKTTNYLIVGAQDPTLVGKKGVSTKEIKAAELIEKGQSIAILREEQFLLLLKFIVPENEQKLVSREIVEASRMPKKKPEEWVMQIGIGNAF